MSTRCPYEGSTTTQGIVKELPWPQFATNVLLPLQQNGYTYFDEVLPRRLVLRPNLDCTHMTVRPSVRPNVNTKNEVQIVRGPPSFALFPSLFGQTLVLLRFLFVFFAVSFAFAGKLWKNTWPNRGILAFVCFFHRFPPLFLLPFSC